MFVYSLHYICQKFWELQVNEIMLFGPKDCDWHSDTGVLLNLPAIHFYVMQVVIFPYWQIHLTYKTMYLHWFYIFRYISIFNFK